MTVTEPLRLPRQYLALVVHEPLCVGALGGIID